MMYRLLPCLLLIGALALAAQAQVVPPPPPRTLSVTGTAETQVLPNLALVVLAVQTQARTLTEAANQNSTIANRVIAAINALNIPRLTVRTLTFDVQPIYEQRPPTATTTTPPRIVGYQVINRVEVRIPSADPGQLSTAVSRVVDAALTAGANRVDNVQLTIENPAAVNREALASAVRNARETAQAMAAAAGVTLGPLQTLSMAQYYQPQPLYAARAMDAAAVVAPPIVAGPLTVSATVSAVYLIQ